MSRHEPSQDQERPTPEKLLERYHLREATPPQEAGTDISTPALLPSERRRPRIYFGMAAGVGKTYARLNEGRHRKGRGTALTPKISNFRTDDTRGDQCRLRSRLATIIGTSEETEQMMRALDPSDFVCSWDAIRPFSLAARTSLVPWALLLTVSWLNPDHHLMHRAATDRLSAQLAAP